MQMGFSELEYNRKKKMARRDVFLASIEAVTPWKALIEELEPFYPKGEGPGRPSVWLERMLRMYVAQQCFGLSDEGIEDAVYDSQSIRSFVGIDLSHESAPDATTVLKFRRLLEKHQLTRKIFDTINRQLSDQGLTMREGTIVDATLIAASPSTKNRKKARDREMHQSRKGNNWYFGLKAHTGVDAESGLVHTVIATSGNEADVTQAHALLHGEEKIVFADAGYQGVEKREENRDTKVDWEVVMKRGKRKALKEQEHGELQGRLEKAKSSIRALGDFRSLLSESPL